MGKIKELLSDQKNAIRNIVMRYTATIITAVIICIIYLILDMAEYNSDKIDVVEDIISYLYIFAVGAFFIESVIRGKISKKLYPVIYIANAAVSYILNLLAVNSSDIFSERQEDYYFRILGFIILLELGISMYAIIRTTGLGLHKYATNFFFGFIRVGAVLLALNIGFMALLEIFDSLIIDINTWDIIGYIEILLTGFVYVPYFLICITDDSEERSKFTKGFVMYLMMPIIIAAITIIYIYIFKIIFTASMPSNEVFSICAQLFVYGVCIWTMAYSFIMDKKKLSFYDKIVKYMKYIYAPFIVLEIYCIAVRIIQYGVTDERYFAVVYIILQLIYIAWEPIMKLVRKILRKDKPEYEQGYEGLIIVVLAMYVITMLLPFTNYGYISYKSQKSRIETAIEELRMTDSEVPSQDGLEAFIGPYNYLKTDVYGKDYLNANYDAEELDMWVRMYHENYDDKDYTRWTSVYYRFDSNSGEIDISGYSKMYSTEMRCGYGDEYSYDELGAIEIEFADTKIAVDLYETVMDIVGEQDKYEYYSDNADEPLEIIIDEKAKLVIYYFRFDYSNELNRFKALHLEGYVMTK